MKLLERAKRNECDIEDMTLALSGFQKQIQQG
jgi:hypothetical protein